LQTFPSILVTTQSNSVFVGQHPEFPPLALQGDVLACAEISIDWRIVNPLKFMTYASDEHPIDVLVLKSVGQLRLLLEEKTLSDARRHRPEIAQKAMDKLAPLLKERGILLEAIEVGAVLELRMVDGAA